MATAKKPAAKKTTTKAASTQKTPVKKTATKSTAKKTVVKSTPAKRPTTTAKKAPASRKAAKKPTAMRSFHVAENNPPFKSFKITRQTVYWLIFICVIIFAQLWILKTQYEVLELLDQQLLDTAFL